MPSGRRVAACATAPTLGPVTQTDTHRPVVRTPADVARLVAHRTTPQPGALGVVILALGGIFMDAYDFSSLAFGIT